MARLTLPAWAQPGHPIVRYERRHWQASRGWRLASGLLWGGSLVFLLVPAACAIIFSLTSTFQSPAELVLGLGGLFTVGLAVISTLLGAFNGLSASILGATLIARERESQTWPFLRLTTLTTREIVLGKLVALFYTLGRPLLIILGLRALAVLSAVVTLVLAYFAAGLTLDQLPPLFGVLLSEATVGPLTVFWFGLLFALSALTSLAFWFLEPVWTVIYNGVVGLAASTLVRSSGAAIGLVFALHLGLALALYAPAQQLSLLAAVPLVQLPSAVSAVVPIGVVVAQIGISLALNVGIVVGGVWLSLRRAETLSD